MSKDPFAPPSAELNSSSQMIYAGFWRRVAASLIDTLLLIMVILPLLFMIFGAEYFDSELMGFSGPTDFIVNYLIPISMTVVFWTIYKATPGKMVMGCQVVNAKTGEKLGVGRSIVRYLGYFVSTFPLGLGLFWVGIDRRKQGWHDKIAGTLVLRIGSALPGDKDD